VYVELNQGASRLPQSEVKPHLHTSRVQGWASFLLAVGTCCLPLFFAPFPPATDLPQHVAQVARALQHDLSAGQYIAWWAPNNLIYAPMAALWSLMSPAWVPRATLMLLGMLWVGAHFLVAWRTGRAWATALLASLSFYNGILYWGMLNFLVAWPCLLLWWTGFDALLKNSDALKNQKADRRRQLLMYSSVVASTLLLAWAHVLALAAAGLLGFFLCALQLLRAGNDSKAQRSTVIRAVHALSSFVPALLFSVPWIITLSSERREAGFFVGAFWTTSSLDRLIYLFTQSFGSGAPAPLFFGTAVLIWVISGATNITARASASHRGEPGWHADLLAMGLLLLGVCFVLPDKFLNTIQFATRWLPCAVSLLCLAGPGPALRSPLRRAFLGLMYLSFTLGTVDRVISYNSDELDGLELSLARVPAKSRVLGLDFLKVSQNFPHAQPFLHLSSYATVWHAATTQFDFGQHGSGLIRGPYSPTPWTPGIEWVAEWAQPRDLLYFDYALVGAPAELHRRFRLAQWMVPVTHSGTWRLYRITINQP